MEKIDINLILEKCQRAGAVTDFNKLVRKYYPREEKQDTNSFNLIKALHIDNKDVYENAHTRVLAEILKYKKPAYLRTLLQRITCNIGYIPQDVEIEVERQYERDSSTGEWCPTKNGDNAKERSNQQKDNDKRCRPDCLIWDYNKFAIIIENKINGAQETPRQLDNYLDAISTDRHIFEQNNPNKLIWILYLSGDGMMMPSGRSLSANKTQYVTLDKTAPGRRREGNKLRLVSYKDVIIPWLEDDVLPYCPYGESGLTGGLMVYIDYLKKRFAQDSSYETSFFDSSDVVDLFRKEVEPLLCPFYNKMFESVRSFLSQEQTERKLKNNVLFFKAMMHYYSNHYFRFIEPCFSDSWTIKCVGGNIKLWKNSWIYKQDQRRPICDIHFSLYTDQVDTFIAKQKTKRAITCLLFYKGKDESIRQKIDNRLESLGIEYKLGNYVSSKSIQKEKKELALIPDRFFDSLINDQMILTICRAIDEALQ